MWDSSCYRWADHFHLAALCVVASLAGAMVPRDEAMVPRDEAMVPRDGAIFPRDEAMVPRDGAIFPHQM